MIRVTAIVSGGQTGADRGGLDAAIQLGLGHGGWAPKGWRAEDGSIPEIYRSHMRESVREDYGLRTRLNVQDSDATLIVSFAEQLTGGSEYTAKQAKAQRKPCKHLVLPARGQTRITDAVRAAILAWIAEKNISILNVAGPRESKEPGLQQAVRDALVWIFEDELVEVVERVRIGVDGLPDESTRSIEFRQGDAFTLVEGHGVNGSMQVVRIDRLGPDLEVGCGQPDARGEFLVDLECAPRPLTKAGIDRLIDAFYKLDGNGAGGSLHVVLDDNNWERSCVESCLKHAEDAKDVLAAALARLLLELTDEQLHDWLGPGYCGRCCADYGDEHVGQTFDNVDGRCPDCGSWPKAVA